MKRLAILSLAVATALLGINLPTSAQQDTIMKADDIVQGLLPKKRTRGLEITGANPGAIPDAAAKVVLKVNFGHNSDELTDQARQQLDALAGALNKDELQQYRFEISGHTTSQGTATYNRALSQRRADRVVAYLAGHAVNRGRLKPIGKGFDEPLNPNDPLAPDNRRVEVRTLAP